jgi:hypothetical protein
MARKKKSPLDPGLIQHIKSLGLPNPLNPGPGLAYAPILDEPYFPYHLGSPGPWEINGHHIASREPGFHPNIVCEVPRGALESAKYWPANAERIVNCVNALEGVHNPQVLPQVLKTLRFINGSAKLSVARDWVVEIDCDTNTKASRFIIGLMRLVAELDGKETGGGDE